MTRKRTILGETSMLCAAWMLLGAALTGPAFASKGPKKTSEQLRTEYLAKVAQTWSTDPATRNTIGSLWSPNGVLNDSAADYKARSLHDVLTVAVSVQTTAAQSGTVDNSRNFSTNSGITGLVGGVSTAAVNPLFAANSASALKGQGQTSSNTAFTTSLSGEVIAVLLNGNLVVEAHQQIDMNNQHEVSAQRGTIGASINRLTAASNVMTSQVQNLTSASNNLTNANVATTVANMTQYNILESTGMAALQQANSSQQNILKLLQQ